GGRLAPPGLGLLEREVRLDRAPDERRQELVVEGRPPRRRSALRDGVAAPGGGRRRRELTPGGWRDDVRVPVIRPDHASPRPQEDHDEDGPPLPQGGGALDAVVAGFALSTRLPSAMFAESPWPSTSVVSSPDSTSTSFP